ncbi:MAG: hypothetical protein E6H05_13815 [Bacillati bacterium ANGP1]|uniref:MASE1 domain-containing protein n=1 Tax=Candidatus Segetimicrobium genomatis TaxID=2569760 RepID=A0A537IGI0_9BACT|nr:MAG: hypothetical protein E6H05_13815 [Terrabacteria group bacterium ANGP1]
MSIQAEYIRERDPSLRMITAVMIAVFITLIGYVAMTVGSSPTVKGASFIWLPAALQLVAGVWLGPWLGLLAGGLGAYAAGILAYGGWGIVDIIMNPIAGGVANAMLPAILFRMYRVDPTLGAQRPADVLSGVVKAVVLAIVVLVAGYLNRLLQLPGQWGFILPLIALFVGARVLLRSLALNKASFLAAVGIAVVSCAASALIGAIGATVGGKPFAAALVDPGIGWFIGDTISAFLGLYLLAMFTQRARAAGIVAS